MRELGQNGSYFDVMIKILFQLSSPFREPILKFALKFPSPTIDFFLCRLFDTTLSRLFTSLLKHKDGGPLREILAASPHKIISTTFSLSVSIRIDWWFLILLPYLPPPLTPSISLHPLLPSPPPPLTPSTPHFLHPSLPRRSVRLRLTSDKSFSIKE